MSITADVESAPIGLEVNRYVAVRVRALVDEYGAMESVGAAPEGRRAHLAGLLQAVLRSLRLDAVSGERYRVARCGNHLRVEAVDGR
jgi:hypothetical protein